MEEEDLIGIDDSPKNKLKLNAYLQNTGKVKNNVDPKYNKIKLSTNQYLQNTSIGKSKYDNNLNFGDLDQQNIEKSVNENRANQQSGWTQVAEILPRAAVKAATEVLKLAPIIYGVGKAAFEDNNTSTLEDIFNNEGIKALDEMNQKINTELLPVYVKDSVKNGNLMDNLMSTSFYATEGADGLGFMASMFVPGMILDKFALGAKLIGGLSKISKMTKMVESAEGSIQVLKGLGWSGRAIDSKLAVLGNSIIEAGAEAKGVQDDLTNVKNLEIESYRNKGFSPEEAEGIFNQSHPDWDNQVASAMKGDFLTQLPMLLGTGAIMQKAIFGKTLDKVEKTVEQGIKGRIGSSVKQWGKSLLSEGFIEEGSQSTLEQYYTKKATEGKLGKGIINDINIGDLTNEYINTVNSTDGAKAVFLGMLMGGPAMSMEARREYKKGLSDSNNITNGVNSAIDDHYLIHENDIYIKDKNGNQIYKKDENGNNTHERVINKVKALEVAKAYKNTETDDDAYDKAVVEGDESLQKFIQNRSILKMIAPAIQNGELGIKILEEQLNETSKLTEIAERDRDPKLKESSKEFNKQILDKAKHLQEQNEKFKDFAADVVKIDDPRATKEDNENYLNHLNSKYLETKSLQYDKESELKDLQKRREHLYDELGINPLYELNSEFPSSKLKNNSLISNEDLTSEGENIKAKIENSPLASKIEKDIKNTKNQILKHKKDIHDLWNNNSDLNKSFKLYLDEKEKIQKETSPEEIAKKDEVINKVDNAITEDEVAEIENTAPKSTINNPVIKAKIDNKKAEIIKAEEINTAEEIATATQEDNDFNNITTYDSLIGTEGSIVTDELIPQENENNTLEELKSIQNSEVDNGLGVKVISTDRNTGLPLGFISEQFPLYLEYEREPVNKSGKEVGFEINQNPGKNPKVLEALNAFNKGDFSNPKLLIDFLPLNVRFTNKVKAPIETKRVTDEINPATELLRISIVNHLINGDSINDIKTTIQDQYKGLLKVDENRFANNNILQLNGVKDLKYVRDNLYVVDSFGNLMNILSGKTKTFSNGKVKLNAAGEIYLSIPQANGKPFPLKLNIKKISEGEAVLLYEIYKEIITNDKALDTTVSEVNDDLREAILKSFEAELNIIGGAKDDIKLQEIIDLLIYQSDNIKSRMQIDNGVLYYGENEADINNIEESQNAIINYLVDSKRHQIKINPKFETDNTKTNLKSNSADYLKYLIDNNILSTNAVVNEPTFQGYTNIYLNTGITVTNQPKVSESGVEVSADDTGFDNLFGNNQENVRNVQENFVSLSEIPGTVENTELKETQAEVFNTKRTPKERQTDFRRMDVLFKKKQNSKLTTEKELRDFEMFKQMYPQEYKKRCK